MSRKHKFIKSESSEPLPRVDEIDNLEANIIQLNSDSLLPAYLPSQLSTYHAPGKYILSHIAFI